MRARCREFDWTTTPLGDVEGWAAGLLVIAETVLAMAFPAIVLWGEELTQLYNDAYIPFLGVKHSSSLGRPTRETWSEVWHINAPIYARVIGGETVSLENARFSIRRQGDDAPLEEFYLNVSYSPVLDEAGEVGGVLVTLTDTTAQVVGRAAEAERQRLEARLQGALLETAMVLDQFSDAYMVLDSSFRIVSLNQSSERVLGRPRAELFGKMHGEAFPDAAGAEPERQYRRVATEYVAAHFVHHYVGDGYDFHLEIDAYPASEGGVAIFSRDITERVRNEAERARLLAAAEDARADAESARVAAEEANRAKSEFLAVMSHELRTPLNAIGGYAELIELGVHGPVTPAQAQALGRIQRSQRHLLGLINGVLNYAKVEAGAVEYVLEDVQLSEVLATCEVLLAPQLRKKGLTSRNDAWDRTLVVTADNAKVQQIVLNLLSNAVKFTDPGGLVTLACAARGDGMVALSVTDTGLGIAPDQMERIFQPFVQVDVKLTRPQEGTGLGLAISRDLARGMGGSLLAESELGVGSVFTVILPAAARAR